MATLLLEPAYFQARVRREIARAARGGGHFSVAVFTIISDYGEHPELACARAIPGLLNGVRDTDTVCRLRDDAIAVLLIDADGAGSAIAAERIVAGLRREADRWDVRIVEGAAADDLLADMSAAA